MGNKKGGARDVISHNFFFFRRNRRDRLPFRGCTRRLKGFSLEGYGVPFFLLAVPSLASSSAGLPAQLFSVLGLLKTRKSRNREGPGTRRARRARRPFSWGCCARIVNGPAERATSSPFLATVLLHRNPSFRVFDSSLLVHGYTGVLNPFLLSAAARNSCTPCRGLKTCVSKRNRAWVYNRCRSRSASLIPRYLPR